MTTKDNGYYNKILVNNVRRILYDNLVGRFGLESRIIEPSDPFISELVTYHKNFMNHFNLSELVTKYVEKIDNEDYVPFIFNSRTNKNIKLDPFNQYDKLSPSPQNIFSADITYIEDKYTYNEQKWDKAYNTKLSHAYLNNYTDFDDQDDIDTVNYLTDDTIQNLNEISDKISNMFKKDILSNKENFHNLNGYDWDILYLYKKLTSSISYKSRKLGINNFRFVIQGHNCENKIIIHVREPAPPKITLENGVTPPLDILDLYTGEDWVSRNSSEREWVSQTCFRRVCNFLCTIINNFSDVALDEYVFNIEIEET